MGGVFGVDVEQISLKLRDVYLDKHFFPFIRPTFLKGIFLLVDEVLVEKFWLRKGSFYCFKYLVRDCTFVEFQKSKDLSHFPPVEELLIGV